MGWQWAFGHNWNPILWPRFSKRYFRQIFHFLKSPFSNECEKHHIGVATNDFLHILKKDKLKEKKRIIQAILGQTFKAEILTRDVTKQKKNRESNSTRNVKESSSGIKKMERWIFTQKNGEHQKMVTTWVNTRFFPLII